MLSILYLTVLGILHVEFEIDRTILVNLKASVVITAIFFYKSLLYCTFTSSSNAMPIVISKQLNCSDINVG